MLQVLKAYFPMTVCSVLHWNSVPVLKRSAHQSGFARTQVKIVFWIVVAAMLSMLTVSGELGGFYLFATRFTM